MPNPPTAEDLAKARQFNALLDTYEEMHGIRAGGQTADYMWQAVYGPRFTDQEWDQLPGPVRDVLDPGSFEEDMFRGDR